MQRFTCHHLLQFNAVNLDYFTETYNLPFYLQYLAKWPEYCIMAEGPSGQAMGYIFGKAEGTGENWHGHVTAVTVAPAYRRQRLAEKLMSVLEDVSTHMHDAYFVDLFVRVSNAAAINMYKKLRGDVSRRMCNMAAHKKFGYTVYRRVLGYYSNDEDAFDMRKALPRDVGQKSVVPLGRPVRLWELEFD